MHRFHTLNTVTVHDSFPLLQIEEALQAVKAAVWFTSFDLAQVIFNWPWMRLTFTKQLSMQVPQVCMSLLICLLASLMQVLVFLLPHGDVSWGSAVSHTPVLPQ